MSSFDAYCLYVEIIDRANSKSIVNLNPDIVIWLIRTAQGVRKEYLLENPNDYRKAAYFGANVLQELIREKKWIKNKLF